MSHRRALVCLVALLAVSACNKDKKPADEATPTNNNDSKTPVGNDTDGTKPDDTSKTTAPNDAAADEPPAELPPGKVSAYGGVFDATCEKADDCVLMSTSKCSHCGCTDFPINAAEVERFRDVASAYECPPPDPHEREISCGGCPGFAAVCTDGMCKAEMR